ncbi:MAG: sporulation protein YtfJ, partial [Clostridia bacterium]|nr:sporulation protein YtfJ [Clostridia bacterium]
MNEHPISGMAQSIMDNINQMADVNTIVGEPIVTPNGVTIIPISKVSVGFGIGGGDFKPATAEEKKAP